MVFHEIIHQRDPAVPALNRVLQGGNVIKDLDTAWTYIVEKIDYVPIFDVARQLLKELYGSPDLDKALKPLGDVALYITSRRAALRHDPWAASTTCC